ncbi:Autophagy-related protein 2 [Pleurotus pulmonarius]
MASWFTSWLPGLPTIDFSLPSTIQRRFISFVLKRTLGHFLRPGQLDVHQIDSQIGSGHVQVNNLELDNKAINSLIDDLPLELQDGSIGSVTARIPWPNPLTSTLGFSIQSLHLTFRLTSSARKSETNLSDSVASVAESFIHDELTPREEATLRESIYSEVMTGDVDDDHHVPGGLNPFLTEPEEHDFPADSDPAGISLFAVLIERLLAKFECDITDSKFTIVSPGESSFTFYVGELSYAVESPGTDPNLGVPASVEGNVGETRKVTVKNVKVTSKDLRPPHMRSPWLSAYSSNAPTERAASPASSSSSLDEDTQLLMSQSIACLPQRPASPTSSVASSMYQSAISTADEPTEANDDRDTGGESRSTTMHTSPSLPVSVAHIEETIFSLGSDTTTIRLTTPSPTTSVQKEGTSPLDPTSKQPSVKADNLKLSVSIGIITSSLRARHLRAVMDMLERWSLYRGPRRPTPPPSSESQPSALSLTVDGSVHVKGIVLVFLPVSNTPEDLSSFYAHPLVPPSLSTAYVRVHIDGIACSSPHLILNGSAPPKRRDASREASTTVALSVSDLSVFAVQPSSGSEIIASPIMITDPLLTMQPPTSASRAHPSDPEIEQLPEFQIVDYTDEASWIHGVRPSFWRTKPKQRTRSHHIRQASHATSNASEHGEASQPMAPLATPAIQVRLARSGDIEVKVVPLHLLLDLGQALQHGGVLAFVGELYPVVDGPPRPDSGRAMDDEDGSDSSTPPATPRQHSRTAEEFQERERRRLERLVMEDLDLDLKYDYRRERTKQSDSPKAKAGRRKRKTTASKLSVKLAMVRLQLRCPSPSRYTQRSGAVILDIFNIELSTGESANKPAPKFVDFDNGSGLPSGNTLASVSFEALSLSLALAQTTRARGLIYATGQSSANSATPPCRVVVMKPEPVNSHTPPLSLILEIASVRAVVPKDLLDGVQYWADDLSQLLEGLNKIPEEDSDTDRASMIGSRFFAKSRSGSTTGSGLTVGRKQPTEQSETVVKVMISEAHLTVLLPRQRANQPSRPIIVRASEIDILLELKPEGKDQTVVTLAVMDASVTDYPEGECVRKLIGLTVPHSVTYTPKPMIKLRFISLIVPETTAKEARIHLTLCGFEHTVHPDMAWIEDLATFSKAPPGAFESVIPSERTKITVKVNDGSIRAIASTYPGAVLLYIGDFTFSTVLGESAMSYDLDASDLAILVVDDLADVSSEKPNAKGLLHWKGIGYALVSEVTTLQMNVRVLTEVEVPNTQITVDRIGIRIHLCADTLTAITAFASDLTSTFNPPGKQPPQKRRRPSILSKDRTQPVFSTVEEHAFNVNPEVGPAIDMIHDDLPTNVYYLDEHFGSAAGLRELRDDDLDDFDGGDDIVSGGPVDVSLTLRNTGVTSDVGSETVKMLQPQGINIVENYYDSLPAIPEDGGVERGPTTLQVRVHHGDVTLLLYDGYDWARTRRIIEDEVKEMRRRLAKIRQLVATGQVPDEGVEETSAMLFNSMYIGLERDPGELEPAALIAAIDEELREDTETATQSSWESLMPPTMPPTAGTAPRPHVRSMKVNGKKLTRSKRSRIEICLMGLRAEVDKYLPDDPTVARNFVTVKDVEILDHIKSSTWKKFLTSIKTDSKGTIRETGSNMVRVELLTVRPAPGHPSEEARLKAKILPLRLYVDQDALDFLKKFFSFKDPDAAPSTSDGEDIYFQHAEVFPVDLKLDYKPRRVDYRALREGRTIELMNFFHFDGAEMTLRHITASGITGWPRFFDLLNDLWTPDVKATQLVDVISGVAPIRSVVNVGSGFADLVLLPIAQFKKDGRVVRGLQRGANSFVKSTAMEAIRLGARLATGTQVILEQAEGVIGGQFDQAITTETMQPAAWEEDSRPSLDEDELADLISKYADQPSDITEGVQSAYKSLRKNLNSAAQTILAVPMEVYERSGDEGPVRAVIRAVPIAVLKPMIGASEAISKTLMGLHNTMDPNVRNENEEKYKQR